MSLSTEDLTTLKIFFSGKPVKKAFLFGSFSRGEDTLESDVDILVELDYSQHIGLSFVRMKSDIEKAINKKIDLVSMQSLSSHLLPFIEKDKKLIYERKDWR